MISGSGTTMTNFLKQKEEGRLDVEIALVIASRADCSGIERAKAAGLPVDVIRRGDFASVEEFSQANFDRLAEANVDLVTLAGYLSLLHVPERFLYRVMNIHPSLIPAFCGHGFYGHYVHEAAIERGVRVSGCTVHFADNEYDHGPIIDQRSVAVPDGCTPDDLASLVFEQECEAYPEAIRAYAEGRISVRNRHVHVAASSSEATQL